MRDDRTVRLPVPEWWPPKVGARLRGIWSSDPANDPLLHVVAVFKHDGNQQIVVAEWDETRQRWSYDIKSIVHAHVGTVRPDGWPRKA